MAPTWRLSLFGTVGLHSDTESYTTFETRRAAKILVLLSFSRSGRMRRDDLADLLWPDDFIDSTRLRLRQELSRLRRGLGKAEDLVYASTDTVSIDQSRVENDLDRLARSQSIPSSELLDMLSEPFLPGWDDAWVTVKRDEVDQTRVRVALESAKALLDQKQAELALKITQAAIAIAPRNEDLRNIAMKAHAALGSLSDALVEFRRFKRNLSLDGQSHSDEQLGATTEQLSPAPQLELPPIPHPIDQFYGRDEITKELREIVASHNSPRLISLVGTGGIGKTRLVIEVFRDTALKVGFISFVECPADSDPINYLLQQLLHGNSAPEPIEVLKRLLQGNDCTLILDNLEHLDDPGKFVANLLGSISDLRLIVTSRKPMKIASEQVFTIMPLDQSEEAIQMLTELTGTKRLASGQVEKYQEIVGLCGGIPLTLRLAAARLRFLEPHELIEELKLTTASLRADLPDLAERHRYLDRMLKVTLSSLSKSDSETLLNISFFPGGVTRAIVRRMVGSDVDEVLERLLDSAFVWLDDDVSPLRFRLLEPIRQFVQEESNETTRSFAKQNFIEQMTAIAESFVDVWDLSCDSETGVFRRESENFRHAMTLALNSDPNRAHILFQRLWHFELSSGRRRELLTYLGQLEALANPTDVQQAHIYLCRTCCLSAEGKIDDAASLGQQATKLFDEVGERAFSLYAMATVYDHQRYKLEWDQVRANYEEVITKANEYAPKLLPLLRVWRGNTLSFRKEWKLAREDLEFGLQAAKRVGNLGSQILAGVSLLTIEYAEQNFERLREIVAETRHHLENLDDPHFWSLFLRAEARVALVSGEFSRAEACARRGLQVFAFAGNVLHEVEIKVSLARALIGLERLDEAEQIVREMAPSIPIRLYRVAVMAVACLSEIREKQGRAEEAKELLTISLAFRDENKVDIHIMEASYLDELRKLLDLSTWERSITSDDMLNLIKA